MLLWPTVLISLYVGRNDWFSTYVLLPLEVPFGVPSISGPFSPFRPPGSRRVGSRAALLSSAFFSRAIEYFCIKDFIDLVVRKGSEISNDPWRTGIWNNYRGSWCCGHDRGKKVLPCPDIWWTYLVAPSVDKPVVTIKNGVTEYSWVRRVRRFFFY